MTKTLHAKFMRQALSFQKRMDNEKNVAAKRFWLAHANNRRRCAARAAFLHVHNNHEGGGAKRHIRFQKGN